MMKMIWKKRKTRTLLTFQVKYRDKFRSYIANVRNVSASTNQSREH